MNHFKTHCIPIKMYRARIKSRLMDVGRKMRKQKYSGRWKIIYIIQCECIGSAAVAYYYLFIFPRTKTNHCNIITVIVEKKLTSAYLLVAGLGPLLFR